MVVRYSDFEDASKIELQILQAKANGKKPP